MNRLIIGEYHLLGLHDHRRQHMSYFLGAILVNFFGGNFCASMACYSQTLKL